MLNIFNNGSSAWILLIVDIIWAAIWTYRLIKSQKSGYNQQTDRGIVDVSPKKYYQNGNFIMLVIGVITITAFIFIINADYL